MRELVVSVAAALAAAFGTVGAAPVLAPPPRAVKAPAGLEGKWVLDSMRRGQKAFDAAPGSMTLEFGPGTLTQVGGVGTKNEVTSTAALALNAELKRFSATNHRDAKGNVVNPDVTYGYLLTGDKLTLATRQGPNLAFGPASPLDPGETDVILVFTRAKK